MITIIFRRTNYNLSIRQSVHQFHLEQRGNKFMKNPNWSLGSYKKTIIVRERAEVNNEKARIVKVKG